MALAIRKVSNSIQAKAKPEAQLGDSEAKAMSLVEGRLWRESTGRNIPPLIQTMRHCLL